MKDHLDVRDGAATHVGLAEIGLQELDLTIQARKIRSIARAEVVDHANGVTQPDEPLGDMRADESRSPCDQAPRPARCQHASPR